MVKRLTLFAALTLLVVLAGYAQTINVHMKSGQTVKYDFDSIEYLDFSVEGSANEVEGAVDLGLSVLWATCNVGAETPEGYGNYYAWGEVDTKKSYNQYNYFRHAGGGSFNSIGSDISGSEYYDVARKELGEPWRMPRVSELRELVNNCSWSRTTMNGVAGYMVTGPNGNQMFIPAAGSNVEGTVYSGNYANLWSSEPASPYDYFCYRLYANQNGIEVSTFPGFYGNTIRPVCNKPGGDIGGGGQGGGDGWVSVNATGYAPYYYCPTTGTTTPSVKVATSSIRAYRNSSTWAYKVNWAGTDYPCSAGYNKLNIGKQSHTTTNSYGNTIVCTDIYYLEFTISN